MSRLADVETRLLTTLTWKLRVLHDAQSMTLLGIPNRRRRAFTRRLERLQQRGLVGRARMYVALVSPTAPLVTWRPGAKEANWGRLTWDLEKRLAFAPREVVTLTWATRPAAQLVGGVGGRLRQPLQIEHDLGTAAVFLRRGHSKTDAARWFGEDAYRRHFLSGSRAKVPDAVLLGQRNRVVRAIEYGGQYSSGKLRAFHRYWSRKRIPYEIW